MGSMNRQRRRGTPERWPSAGARHQTTAVGGGRRMRRVRAGSQPRALQIQGPGKETGLWSTTPRVATSATGDTEQHSQGSGRRSGGKEPYR